MKILINKTFTSIIATALLLFLAVPGQAEVSLKGNGASIFLGGSAGQVWAPHRQGLAPNLLLNPRGDLRGDQFGDWSTNPETGLAEVVWSRNMAGRFEVVFSWFEDGAWRGPVNISRNLDANDLTPKIYHDHNGSRYVVWTSYGKDVSSARISVSQNGPPRFTRNFEMNEADHIGRYPSALVTEFSVISVHEEVEGEERFLRVFEYMLLSPFTRSTPMENPFDRGSVPLEDGAEGKSPDQIMGSGQSTTLTPGTFPPVPQSKGPVVPSDPQVHLEGGFFWVDWLQSETRVGFSVHDGTEFGEPQFMDVPGASDLDAARQRIRARIHGKRNAGR